MNQPLFDTWKCVRILRRHHFSEQQARGLLEAQMFAANKLFAEIPTRTDLQNSEYAMRADLALTQHKLAKDIKVAESRFEAKIGETESRLEAKISAAESRLEIKIAEVEYRLEIKINALEAKISDAEHRLKKFVLKATLSIILANFTLMGLFVALVV